MLPNEWQRWREGVYLADEAATLAAGRGLARMLPANAVITLSGDLGAGKTTLVRGMAPAWGISSAITSPTYQLYHRYRGARCLIHLDAYRLQAPEQVDELLIEDLLIEPWNLLIEWPERLPPQWRACAWAFELSSWGQGRRLTLRAAPTSPPLAQWP